MHACACTCVCVWVGGGWGSELEGLSNEKHFSVDVPRAGNSLSAVRSGDWGVSLGSAWGTFSAEKAEAMLYVSCMFPAAKNPLLWDCLRIRGKILKEGSGPAMQQGELNN